jgi:Protein of unknown function (DUF3237)
VPLCTMRLTAKPPVEVGAGPAGTRIVFDETSVQVHGDRLRGQMEGTANDCVLVGPEGTGTIDVRVTLRTDDGAAIFVQYQGRIDLFTGLSVPADRLRRASFRDRRRALCVAKPDPGRGQRHRQRRPVGRLRVVRGPLIMFPGGRAFAASLSDCQ